MKIRLIKKKTILVFVERNKGSRPSFEYWLKELKGADWNMPSDICNSFTRADLLGNGSNRVVFNIGGNNYRIICQYEFYKNEVFLYVCWVGTHAEYDRICSLNRQYYISEY